LDFVQAGGRWSCLAGYPFWSTAPFLVSVRAFVMRA